MMLTEKQIDFLKSLGLDYDYTKIDNFPMSGPKSKNESAMNWNIGGWMTITFQMR